MALFSVTRKLPYSSWFSIGQYWSHFLCGQGLWDILYTILYDLYVLNRRLPISELANNNYNYFLINMSNFYLIIIINCIKNGQGFASKKWIYHRYTAPDGWLQYNLSSAHSCVSMTKQPTFHFTFLYLATRVLQVATLDWQITYLSRVFWTVRQFY